MPLRLDTDCSPPMLLCEGIVTIEETDQLLEALQQHPDLTADLSACEHLHTAPLQTLRLFKIPLRAVPDDPFWRFLLPSSPFGGDEEP